MMNRELVAMEKRHAFKKSILTGRRFLLQKNKYISLMQELILKDIESYKTELSLISWFSILVLTC